MQPLSVLSVPSVGGYSVRVWQILLADSLLFVSSGLEQGIINVSDPTAPVVTQPTQGLTNTGIVSMARVDSVVYGVGTDNEWIMLDARSNTIHVLGWGDPSPVAWCMGLSAQGSMLYLSGAGMYGNGFVLLYDATDPLQPALLATLDLGQRPSFGNMLPLRRHTSHIVGVELAGLGAFRLADFSQVWNPSVADVFMFSGDPRQIRMHAGNILLALLDSLMLMDLTNPASPVPVSEIPGTNAQKYMEFRGDTLVFVKNYQTLFYDVQQWNAPQLIGTLYAWGPLAVQGDTLYVMDVQTNALLAYDIQDPAQAQLLGQMALPGGWAQYYYYAQMRVLDPQHLVLIGYSSPNIAEVRVVDVTDPAQMAIVGGINLTRTVWDLEVLGMNAFLGADGLGVVALDLSTYQPMPVDTFPLIGGGKMALSGFSKPSGNHFLYVSAVGYDVQDTVRLLDVTDPANLTEVAWYVPGVEVRDLAADLRGTGQVAVMTPGGFLLLAADPTGVKEADRPLQPMPVRVNVVRGGLRVEAPVGRLEVYDGMGRRVLRRGVSGRTVLPLRPGLYFWTYRTDDRKVGGKVLVLP